MPLRKNLAFCFLLLLLMVENTAFSQGYQIKGRAKIYTEEYAGDSVVLKAYNNLSIPVTVEILLTLDNLNTAEATPNQFIIPAQTTRKTIAVLHPIDGNKSYKYTLSWKTVPGDTSKTPDLNFPYSLPYLKGRSYQISQGPHEPFSHKNVFAYDFDMPIGTPVCAARDGIIAFVKNDSEQGGPDKKYIEDANFVSVYHQDGTLANYYHLNKTTLAIIQEGQFVKKGQVIGYSGNTGFSDGAHLHFEIIQPSIATNTKKWLPFQWESSPDNMLSMNSREITQE